MALFKVPATKGHNKFIYSLLSFTVSSVLSFIFFEKSIHIDQTTMLFGLAWGAGYALLVLWQMEMLKKLDTNAFFPITSISSHVFVVAIGLLFFHDKISFLQFLGIFIAFIVIGFYNQIHRHITLKNGLLAGIGAVILLSTLNKFIQKFGSISTETNNFIFWQLFFAMLSSLVILILMSKNGSGENIKISKYLILWSSALGILNFIGTAEITKALSNGPFSLVYTINGFYILITSLIAWKFFGEKLTRYKVGFMIAAILAVILIGLK